MNRWMVTALNMGIATALAIGLSACNHDASADAGTTASNAAPPANAPGPEQAPAPAPPPPPADNGPKYAKVVGVTPVNSTTNTPQQVCRDVVVQHTAPPKDQHRIAGTAIGAVAGGLLGHIVGSGKGNTLATVAGAVGGGYAGNRIEAAHQQGQVYTTTEHRCSTVNQASTNVVGYDVRYEYNGVVRTVRMDHDPGDRLQVQEGVVAVSDARQ